MNNHHFELSRKNISLYIQDMPSKYIVLAPPPLKNKKKKKTSENASPELSLNDQLIEAVRMSQIDEVEKLLILGANINYRSKNGWCAIHWVARTGNLQLIEYLFKQGAIYT